MNRRIILLFLSVFSFTAFAQNRGEVSVKTDFAYYFKSDYVSGPTHFAGVTGPYDGIGLRSTFCGNYFIPVGESENPLFAGNNICLGVKLEVCPISFRPEIFVSYTPAAFARISAGSSLGTGWKILGMQGSGYYDVTKDKYEARDAFRTWRMNSWAKAELMFDLAAVWPGDYHHVVSVVGYEIGYVDYLNGPGNNKANQWITTYGEGSGLRSELSCILGYQIPSENHSMAGVQFVYYGYLDSDKCEDYMKNFKFDFKTASFDFFYSFDMTKKDQFLFACTINSRRSFVEDHDELQHEPMLTYFGREWFFDRLAVCWTHKFF